MRELFPGVLSDGRRLLTRNLVKGRSLSEQLVTVKGEELRVWDPSRSKLGAAIAKGLRQLAIRPGGKVLYLGAANGNTVSYVSDIVGANGIVYAVEVSERAFRELAPIAEKRGNIVPILADARLPEGYGWVEPVDCVFQDVATNDQVEILAKNCERFLKPHGSALLSLKTRSIDAVAHPAAVVKEAAKKLREKFEIAEQLSLEPYEKDHAFFALWLRKI